MKNETSGFLRKVIQTISVEKLEFSIIDESPTDGENKHHASHYWAKELGFIEHGKESKFIVAHQLYQEMQTQWHYTTWIYGEGEIDRYFSVRRIEEVGYQTFVSMDESLFGQHVPKITEYAGHKSSRTSF